jgi:hypothetical protein
MTLLALATAGVDPAYRTVIAKHRAERVRELTAPGGWLAVAGLFWLHEGHNTAGSDQTNQIRLPARAPGQLGAFELKNGTVRFVAHSGVTVKASTAAVREYVFDPEKGEKSAIVSSGLRMFIIRRGERYAVRLIDPETAARKEFKGLEYFPLRSEYRVDATFVMYDTMKDVPVPNILGMMVPMESPGYVVFSLNGHQYRLEPVYETRKHEDLFFIFKDLTSLHDTYPAGRFLHAPLPSNGRVAIDFNKAYNPPCAFTAFATCPLPTKDNQLQIRIEAGELRYHLQPSTSAEPRTQNPEPTLNPNQP